MKDRLQTNLALAAFALLFVACQADDEGGYAPQSRDLQTPEAVLPYLAQAADFRLRAIDPEYGGVFTNLERDGTPTDANKQTLRQSRAIYGLVRAFQTTGDERYLDAAEGILDFLFEHAWDREHAGWHPMVNRRGAVAETGDRRRSAYVEHYALLGVATLAEVADSPVQRRRLEQARAANDRLWDERESVGGYYMRAARDGTQRDGKSFTAEADAITAHLLFDYLTGRSPERRRRLQAVGDNLLAHLVGNMASEGVAVLFPYAFDSDWNIDRTVTCLDTGHLLKTAWHMGRLYQVLGDTRYRDAAAHLLDTFRSHGQGTDGALWHEKAGIARGRAFWGTGRVYQDSGTWWTQEQAIAAGLLAWHITGREPYLEIADRTLDFFMRHYLDREQGEAFVHVAPDGTVLNERKGYGFHTAELLYSVYLYGNLFLHRRPVTLYYRFAAEPDAREIRLTPLAIPDEALVIAAATRDGKPYSAIDESQRSLTLPAGIGGVFRVTFAPAE